MAERLVCPLTAITLLLAAVVAGLVLARAITPGMDRRRPA